MTHVVIGYPSIKENRELINMMVYAGVDFIELQIPFSDPLGDGPTIHQANTEALSAGICTKDAFNLVKTLREEDRIDIPFFFMTYMNIPFTYGLRKFCQDAQKAGIDGLIIPDYNLGLENIDHFDELCNEYNQILIRFSSLDSKPERMKFLSDRVKGFVYCFGFQGITGVRKEINKDLIKHLQYVREYFSLPLAVGFGISSARHIHALKGQADIIVAGSVLIEAFQKGGIQEARVKLHELIKAL